MTGIARSRVRVDDRFHTPEALRDRYAGYDMVVATRMHAAILALCAGTPVMPLAYEFKTAELFGRLGFAGKVPSIERSEEHTSELQSLMRNSYAVFSVKKK